MLEPSGPNFAPHPNDELIRTTGCDEIKYHLREQRYRFYLDEKIKTDVEQAFVDILKMAYMN